MQLFSCIVAFVATVPVWGCSCAAWPSAMDAWRSSPVVFLGSVERVDPNLPDDQNLGEQTVVAHVDEAFKGASKNQVFTLKQPGHNCAPKFKPGDRVLFYLHPGGEPAVWEAPGCHRTRRYADAADDLLFLHRLPASAEGNRLSGEVELYENGPEGFSKVHSLSGVKVTVTPREGPPLTTTANADGVYEWYSLPAGDYQVGIEVPKGLRIKFQMVTGRRRAGDGTVHLERDSAISVDYVLVADTKITGSVLDPDGRPMDGVCVDILPVSSDQPTNYRVFDCTKSGEYKLEMMPPGQYYVVANRDGQVTASEPFPTVYYPGTTDLRKAVPIRVLEGGTVDNVVVRVPAIRKSVELSGRVVFSDGVPVPRAFVKFVGQAKSHDETVVAQADGSFRLRILGGGAGELQAEIRVGFSEASACPQFAPIRPEGFVTYLKSAPVVINEQLALSDIKLNMQVASCQHWPRPR